MKILITTGIYPPQIGGPAQYAKNLEEAFSCKLSAVRVLTYRIEKKLPTGVRHFWFFFRTLIPLWRSDFCIALDQFSVGFPSVLAGKILGKKIIIRTGGDFLWESYVERTGDLVLFREFYDTRKNNFSPKEKLIFFFTQWTLQNASTVAFSTPWQRDIFLKAYSLKMEKTEIIENYYAKENSLPTIPEEKRFIAGTRNLKWKNGTMLKRAFEKAQEKDSSLMLDTDNAPYQEFMEKMRKSYAVILVSLGDISPNMILDAIRLQKPFIATKEIGTFDRIKDIGLFVDPKNEDEIVEKILFLSQKENYELYLRKIKEFSFTHSYEEIANEFIKIYERSK